MKDELKTIIQSFSKSAAGYIKVIAGGESLELLKKGTPSLEGPAKATKQSPSSGGGVSQNITSKYVGRFRMKEPAIEIGSTVQVDEVVGAVDSVGLKNDVLSPTSGVITEVSVNDGDIVEFGQILFTVKEER